MKNKTLFNVILSILMLIGAANAASFYDSFDFSFGYGVPNDMIIESFVCQDASCTQAVPANVNVYSGDSITCWNTYSNDLAGFNSCMANYRVNGALDLSNPSVILEYDTNPGFGYVTYFFTSGDDYMSKRVRHTGFICDAEDVCFYNGFDQVNFNKANLGIAEVGQLNVKNIDNPLLPVQVEVPVIIEETVCSALRFTDANIYRPVPPVGYSDYSADTLVSLDITNNNDGTSYLSQSIIIPIEADTCAGLAPFSWTPDASLENVEIKFRAETDVIDNQFLSSTIDWAEVIETVYPSDLDGSCWTRAYDFTLSNVPDTSMTTSVAQITQGESLYAVFRAGAFRDFTITPMSFEAIVSFDGNIVTDQLFSTGPAVTEDDLGTYIVDLTNNIAGLPTGQYNVSLITDPVGSGCLVSHDVEQTQNLELLAPQVFEVTFHVRDPDFNLLEGANVDFTLLDASDYYVVDPLFDETLTTDANGEATFLGVFGGDYTYLVSAAGFTSVTNDVLVGADMDIYITLPSTNTAPMIDLPTEITEYYMNSIEIDMRDYVVDYNDAFADLVFSYNVVGGTVNVAYNNGVYTFTTTTPNLAQVEITVMDPSGAQSSDIIRLNFIDNEAPVINMFEAQPDNGNAPFNAPFNININDADGDSLTCFVDFGDGTFDTINNCETLTYLEHSYVNSGTYTATLTVNDGVNDPVEAQEMIFVFERTIESPVVNYFRLTSSNGVIVPTDLYLEWDVSHSGGYAMTCTLRVNGVDSPVACVGNTDIIDFNLTGISRFHIIAVDVDGTQVVRTITQEFFPDTIKLNSVTTGLIVDEEIVPGEFNFAIETTNETLAQRDIFIEPMIVCRGIENKLADSRLLDSSAVSRNNDGITSFRFTTDTREYKLKVPTEENCEFKVVLTDGFGSNLELNEGVMFRYLTEETPVASIRGEGTDIVNYIGATMANPMINGYNTIEFKAVNNEAIAKELTITMTSAQLGVEYSLELNLGAGQEREVQIPIFIGENVESGMYPIRYGVREGSVKQVRYSYVIVE